MAKPLLQDEARAAAEALYDWLVETQREAFLENTETARPAIVERVLAFGAARAAATREACAVTAEARAAALRAALGQYGQHTAACQQQSVHVCACGLDALLAAPQAVGSE